VGALVAMASQTTEPSLSSLPSEILFLTCADLPVHDINALSQTSRKFAYLLDSLLYAKAATHTCKDGMAVLVWAAREGRLSVVEKILGQGLTNIAHKDRFLALYQSAEQGHEEIVRRLLATLPDPDANRPELRCIAHAEPAVVIQLLVAGMNPYIDIASTALDGAARAGHLNVVRLLLDSGVDLKSHSDALPAAATAGHEEVVRLLLASGMSQFPSTISYALRAAAHAGHTSLVKLLLESYAPYGAPPFQALENALDAGHEGVVEAILSVDRGICEKSVARALSSAALAGRPGMVRILLDAMTSPPSQSSVARLLRNAARYGHEATVKVLLEVITEEFAAEVLPSVLFEAAETGRSAIVRLLLDAGADPSAGPQPSEIPLSAAARRGHVEVAKILIAKGAKLDAETPNGWTPIHEAAMKGHFEVVRLLLDAGIHPSFTNYRGETALHRAAFGGYPSVVQELLNSGVNVDLRDGRQLTALHMAAYEGREEVVRLLVQAGADVSVQNPVGWTPLDLAAMRGHAPSVKLLLSTSGLDASEENVKSVLASIAEKTSTYTERLTSIHRFFL
jgi:ankyrin repeat protein